MSAFFSDLWESVFTPGPTPVLLRAANVTFAALQLIFLALLFLTHSLHFVALSFICAGLWWAINWFAAEVVAVQESLKAAEKEKEREGSEDSGTEVEGGAVPRDIPEVKAGGEEGVAGEGEGLRRREAAAAATTGTQSSASTEDEWEKVSESENDKQK